MKLKIDRFVPGILFMIVLAYFFPDLGSKNSPVPLDTMTNIGISLIFFFYGLKLSPEKIKNGLANGKLHLLIQLSTFVIFPLIIIAFYPFISSEQTHTIWLSFLFLAALPSTVSSSVVMVSIARGNIPAAIFNASISGMAGIIITPLWIGLFLEQRTGDFSLGTVYLKLITEILVPVTLGLLLEKRLGKYALRYGRQLSRFDKSIILLIIYKSFSVSFEENVFSSVHISDLLIILCAVVMVFYLMFFLTGFLSRHMEFTTEDRITAQFCGTKKSLVHGTVFSKILFPASLPSGIILLPLMIFHAIQIFIVSLIASRLSKRTSTLIIIAFISGTTSLYGQSSFTSVNDSSGFYFTYEDFINGNISNGFPNHKKGYTVWPRGFFCHKDPELKTPDTTIAYKRTELWGYTDHKGRLIRIFSKKHYRTTCDKGIVIYIIHSPVKTSYHFSKSLNDEIFRLTKKNLLKVYRDDKSLLQTIRSSRKNQWLVWDDKHQYYRLNEIVLNQNP